jgi:hypothetical protein
VAPSPSLPLCLPHCVLHNLPHCVSHCVSLTVSCTASLTVSPTVSPSLLCRNLTQPFAVHFPGERGAAAGGTGHGGGRGGARGDPVRAAVRRAVSRRFEAHPRRGGAAALSGARLVDLLPRRHAGARHRHRRLAGRSAPPQCSVSDSTQWRRGFRFGRASPPHRPREDGLAHPADTSISNIASALALLRGGGFPTPSPEGKSTIGSPSPSPEGPCDLWRSAGGC